LGFSAPNNLAVGCSLKEKMQKYSVSPLALITSLLKNKELIIASSKREILSRYRGSALGLLWSFVNPLIMLCVYTFVFGGVFKARWGDQGSSKSEFALVLFSGLIVFNFFSECVNRAPNLIVGNPNYVKKVIFPLEIMIVTSVITALYHALISLFVWVLTFIVFFGIPKITIVLLPLVIAPLIILVGGLSWMLSAMGVYIRDIGQFIGVLTTILMFLSPIFYPISSVPEQYRIWLYMNPLTIVVEMSRDLMYWGSIPDLKLLLVFWVISILIGWLGFVWFQKIRKGFADVL
jgi:lipopolysaccharide transport system permease protein